MKKIFLSKSKLSFFFSVALSAGVVFYVLYKLNWTAIKTTITELHWGWLVLALFVFALNYVFRTLRFQVLLEAENASFIQFFSVTSLYGMYNYLLPAKSGEVTFVALAKSRLSIPLIDGISSLFAVRYFDFATIALFLPLVLFTNFKTLPSWLIYASLIYIGGVLILSIIIYFFLQKPFVPVKKTRMTWIDRFYRALAKFRKGMSEITSQKKHIPLFFYTILIWLCVYTNTYLIVLSLGYQLSYFHVIVISIIMIPMTLLPIQGFANLGTHEIGWVTAFSIFGQPENTALSIAFSSHIILLFTVLLLGFSSLLFMSFSTFTKEKHLSDL